MSGAELYRALYDGGCSIVEYPTGRIIRPPARITEVINARMDIRGPRTLEQIAVVCNANNVWAHLYDEEGSHVGTMYPSGRYRLHNQRGFHNV